MKRQRLEGNFTQIPNKILEAIIKAKLSGTEKDIIWVIFRETYGWGTDYKQISNTNFSRQTGLDKSYCIKLIKRLKSKKLFRKTSGDKKYAPNFYQINEDTEEWLVPFRNSEPQLTGDLQYTSGLEATKSSEPQVLFNGELAHPQEINKEINKDSEERIEKIKERIRKGLGSYKSSGVSKSVGQEQKGEG